MAARTFTIDVLSTTPAADKTGHEVIVVSVCEECGCLVLKSEMTTIPHWRLKDREVCRRCYREWVDAQDDD